MRIEGAGVSLNNYSQNFYVGGVQRGQQAGQPARVGGASGGSMEFATDFLFGPAVSVDISPQARAAYADSQLAKDGKAAAPDLIGLKDGSPDGELKAGDTGEVKECQTCKNRKYQDGSDDAGVSYQSPTHISPGNAGAAVAAHEGEHVAHEQAKAAQEGRKVVSQSVTIHTSVCPECGRVYVSGGETRTKTAGKAKAETPEQSENKTQAA